MKKLVRGNSFYFTIRTDIVRWENNTSVVEGLNLSSMLSLSVTLYHDGASGGAVDFEIVNSNTIRWQNGGNLTCGVYGLEITCKDTEGCNYRFYNDKMFKVVDKTKEGSLPADVEFASGDIFLGVVYIAGANIKENGYTPVPDGGWLMNDMCDNIRSLLGKAGTALQQHQSLAGYETKAHAEEIYQPKGNYLVTETDPTVPSWAKQPNKPSYTASEVGAMSADTPIPTKTSDLTNDSGFLTAHQDISGKQDVIADLATIRSGAALGATALQPVQGKGLSTNDYTDEDKAEVAKVSQVGADIGQLSALETSAKTNLVAAVNEVNAKPSGYNKPTDGIPITDLTSTLQTSISRADAIYDDYINAQNLI